MKKLSTYTHAKYCTDEADILAGLTEIRKTIEYRKRMNKTIPSYYYSRKNKLKEKLKPIVTKGLRVGEFRYKGHIFQAERQFKTHEIFSYVGRRLTRLVFDGWNWDEFYACADTVEHKNQTLLYADIFLMDRDYLVVPCGGFLGKYEEIKLC